MRFDIFFHLCHEHARPYRNAVNVARVTLKEDCPMPPVDQMPDVALPGNTYSALLTVVDPRLADGSPASGPFTWATSDAAALPLQAQPDTVDEQGRPVYAVLALTPQDSGAGVVTFSGFGLADAAVRITYAPAPLGHVSINVTPVPE